MALEGLGRQRRSHSSPLANLYFSQVPRCCCCCCSREHYTLGSTAQNEGFQGGSVVKEPTCQCRRCRRRGFDPWVGKMSLEKEMATHPSILAWEIPWTEELGRLQPVGSQGVGHD